MRISLRLQHYYTLLKLIDFCPVLFLVLLTIITRFFHLCCYFLNLYVNLRVNQLHNLCSLFFHASLQLRVSGSFIQLHVELCKALFKLLILNFVVLRNLFTLMFQFSHRLLKFVFSISDLIICKILGFGTYALHFLSEEVHFNFSSKFPLQLFHFLLILQLKYI